MSVSRSVRSLSRLVVAVVMLGLAVVTVFLWGTVQKQEETIQLLQRETSFLRQKLDAIRDPSLEQSLSGSARPAGGSDASAQFLPAYGTDEHGNKTVAFWIRVPDRLPIAGKLRAVAHTLSRVRFSDRPIELSRIGRRDGRLIATINLRDNSADYGMTWYGGCFQGSTGGGMTTVTLRETFLQRDYEGEWIDGVEFLLNGKPLEDQDHTALSGTIYRD